MIKLPEQIFHPHEIVYSRRKTISIIVNKSGKVTLRAPLKAPNKAIIDCLTKYDLWIREKLKKIESEKLPEKSYIDGECFLILGNPLPLKIVNDIELNSDIEFINNTFYMRKSKVKYGKLLMEGIYKILAKQYIIQRAFEVAEKVNLKFTNIHVTDANRRWGSCSGKNSINFAWRLIMTPPKVIDYVIIHELVHTIHKNHSQKFWNMVSQLMPDYKEHLKWLKTNEKEMIY